MEITISQVFIILALSLVPAALAFRLGTELLK